ncbi:Acetyl-coenzyme A synthetase [Smittium culicis]|uniref:Acetyl-coenzyme A synthetase n=1 Tax=Smittium culicis TaxID=133412 RepID=A0A1R1YQ93_9FUNG|nr:Acetyl-coenzyme A synthetase [Smittium culicis]
MVSITTPQDTVINFYPPKINDRYPVGRTPTISTFEQYKTLYNQSINEPDIFWAERASELIEFTKPYEKVHSGSLEQGNVEWFIGGELNISYNCVDRWAETSPDNIAISFEPDQPGNITKITYKELLEKVCKLAGVYQSFGLKKGDSVAIYMPTIPEAVVAMLACTRLGLVHTVVFAGFSAQSLSERIKDSKSTVVLTVDQGYRGGKIIQTKATVDEALKTCPDVKNVLVFERTSSKDVKYTPGRDILWSEAISAQKSYIPPVSVGSEDPTFILYTSGSTGKPKGMVHTTAGYLLGAAMTSKYTFDLAAGDVMFCTADVGWITGHSYGVYGPLALGVTTVLFESVPTYPDGTRLWKAVDEHKVTQFYTAPTVVRALRRLGDELPKSCDLCTLRVLGSVGEPINPEAWVWYSDVIGEDKCSVVDTYWQTETGSHLIAPLAFATTNKPGSASFPMFGIEPAILDPNTGEELKEKDVTGVLCIKRAWPSIARTILGDHDRYMATCMNVYKGYYFCGDGATRDKDGYYWIRGRIDDVINVSGHRMSTSEIESAIILNQSVAESAVVGIDDELTGQSICAFVTLIDGIVETPEIIKSIISTVRKEIGPIATPKNIIIVQELPKTRFGKIIRRVLRKIASREVDQLGDTSTLADSDVLDSLIKKTLSALVL